MEVGDQVGGEGEKARRNLLSSGNIKMV